MAKSSDLVTTTSALPPHGESTRSEAPTADHSDNAANQQIVAVRPPVVQIRSYTLADIPAVLRLPGKVRLDVPDSLVVPGSSAIDLPAALPILRRQRPTFIAETDGHPIGFVRFSPRRPDGRWVLAAIAASTGVYAPEPVWEALLAYGVRSAGLRGVRRLFARVPVGHSLTASLREGHWIPYARETVYRADRLRLEPSGGTGVRPQEPPDTWAIHQLYASAAPRKVQEIEALTSHVWHMDAPRKRRRRRARGWLVERDGQVAGYARVTRGPHAGMIDLVVTPGDTALFGMLLDAALAGAARDRRPVYCALRGYASEFGGQLTRRGFTETGEQELLIRYTTATARMPVHEPVVFPIELRPAMPRRVPTFLEGQSTEGRA